MADKIQADFDALKSLEGQILAQGEAMEGLLRKLSSQSDLLAKGWIGDSGTRFQREMQAVIVPAFSRLYASLGRAGEGISKVSANLKNAEEEASRLLQGGAGGADGAGAAGSVAASGGGASGATASGSGTAGGSGGAAGGDGGGPHYSRKSGVQMSSAVEKRMGEIADAYHKKTGKSIVLTSGTRSASEQADAMYNKIKLGDDVSKLYKNKTAVAEIKTAYDQGVAAKKTEAQIRADMTSVIQKQVDSGTYISRHLRAGGVDVRTKDMSAAEKSAFREAVAGMKGVTVIEEKKPPHFHLQFDAP